MEFAAELHDFISEDLLPHVLFAADFSIQGSIAQS